jgi:hypothetical protein
MRARDVRAPASEAGKEVEEEEKGERESAVGYRSQFFKRIFAPT